MRERLDEEGRREENERKRSYERTGERRRSPFPSYIYFLNILSVSCLFTSSSEDGWKASAQLKGEEDLG